ncbi:MAG: SET domain-containing protein-lysine N-methyltransferase [Chitinophagales bacterium]|nr:SET domain-containing protein-lysine N-methyltransferase [Chitinophagales bacterium]
MHLYIKEIKEKGRAVFCDEAIAKGMEIEVCPVIVCPNEDRVHIDKTYLYNYYFNWNDDQKATAIALGFGSLYNHAYEPNAIYECYFEEQIIKIIANEDIPAHTEITISYNYDIEDKTKVWFDK